MAKKNTTAQRSSVKTQKQKQKKTSFRKPILGIFIFAGLAIALLTVTRADNVGRLITVDTYRSGSANLKIDRSASGLTYTEFSGSGAPTGPGEYCL
jgi:hypothetical protein